MSDLKLVYFNIRGRAEMIRLMLAAAGKKYDEELIKFEDWPKVKPTTPFGTLPYMVYKGKTYGQSIAMAPFLARELGYYGKTNAEGCRISEVMGLWEDQLSATFPKYRFSKSEDEKATVLKKILEEDLPRFFGYFEKFLKENGSTGYIVGKSLTLADFYLYDMTDNLIQLKKDVLDKYPLMKKLRQTVEEDKKVKAYLKDRKETAF